MNKSKIMNSGGAVFVGAGATEWNNVPKDMEGGAFGATGGSLAITSNRFSYCMGMKGPSMSADCHCAAGLIAVYLGYQNVMRESTVSDYSLSSGVYIMMWPSSWVADCAAEFMGPTGRCQTFDKNADGYARGEGTISTMMKTLCDRVDGELIAEEDANLQGVISSGLMNTNGKCASLSAPNGPAQQELIADALRIASLSPLDIDAVECYGAGAILADAVEVSSHGRIYRGDGDNREVLACQSSKSIAGNLMETSGILGLMKVCMTARWGVCTPNQHLRQINPHLDLAEKPVIIPTENVEFRMRTSFQGVQSWGFGGTNVHIVAWGKVDDWHIPDSEKSPKDEEEAPKPRKLVYWPGGGGYLENDELPRREYTLVGSFNGWSKPVVMMEEEGGDDTWSAVISLGENCWEQFQVWLDGESRRALHPAQEKGINGSPVYGPTEGATGVNWIIDGRKSLAVMLKNSDAPAEGQEGYDDGKPPGALHDKPEGTETDEQGRTYAFWEVRNEDRGKPGDRYKVTLAVKGKWRSLVWRKVEDEVSEGATAMESSYYVVGTWNDWTLRDELKKGPDGTWSAEVKFTKPGANEFQIVRNRDWMQCIYPSQQKAKLGVDVQALGPDDNGHGLNWCLEVIAGDVYKIDLTRKHEDDKDEKKVTWSHVRKEELNSEQLALAARKRYFIVGTFDEWRVTHEMQIDGQDYTYELEIGKGSEESFQILAGNDWQKVLHPAEPDGRDQSPIVGPDANGHGKNWTIGKDGSSYTGDRYKVRLVCAGPKAEKVEWAKVE